MKYLIPEAILILLVIFFTRTYTDICIYFFEVLYRFTSLKIFSKLFLAFPFVTLFVFVSIGCAKNIRVGIAESKSGRRGMKIFVKENFISVIILIAFSGKVLEAVSEVGSTSPYWTLHYGSFDLLLNMIGIFCISSVIFHLLFLIGRFFAQKVKIS